MCKAQPQLRCETHALQNLTKAKEAVARFTAETKVFAEHDIPLPNKVQNQLNKAKATLMKREQERLELLFHQYTNAKAHLLSVELGKKGHDSYTDKAKLIVAEVEALRSVRSDYADILATNALNRSNVASFLNNDQLPDDNHQIIEMLNLIEAERTTRSKDASGKWITTPTPLSDEEISLKESTLKLLLRGINEPAHITVQKKIDEATEKEARRVDEEIAKAKKLKAEQMESKRQQKEEEKKQYEAKKSAEDKAEKSEKNSSPTPPLKTENLSTAETTPVPTVSQKTTKELEQAHHQAKLKQISDDQKLKQVKQKEQDIIAEIASLQNSETDEENTVFRQFPKLPFPTLKPQNNKNK